jgi:hypothetical protein
MKYKDLRNKARNKFWIGISGTIVFGFAVFIAFLKSIHVSFKGQDFIGDKLSGLIGDLISFIYSYTDFATIFWEKAWPILPIFNIFHLFQESNYYFFALLAVTLFFYIQLQDSFWLSSKANKILREVEDEELKRDIKKQRGHIEEPRPDILELEINVSNPDPWFKRPLGMFAIGLTIAVLGKAITSILGISG